MASSGLVVPRIAEVAGYPPAAVLRMVRDLQGAGLAPLGTYGRGKQHGQFEREHLANLLLAFAGPQPVDAAEAAGLLRDLPLEASHRRPATAPGTLGEAFARWIDNPAKAPALVALSTNPRMGNVTWGRGTDLYLPPKGSPVAAPGETYRAAGLSDAHLPRLHRGGAVRKPTHLLPAMFQAAHELWADTLRSRPSEVTR